MKKILNIILITLLMVVFVNAEICTDTPISNKTCEMVTPPISCTTYNYTIYDNNKTINEIGNLSLYGDGLYYFNFSKKEGQFAITLCDGTYREIYVNGDGEVITGSIIAILGVIGILLFIYYKLDEEEHTIFKTFILCFIVYLTLLIPRALNNLISTEFSFDFIKYYLWFIRIFTIYLVGYFIYRVAKYYQKLDVFKEIFGEFKNKGGK